MMKPFLPLTPATLKKWQDEQTVCLVDVREPFEHTAERIAGSTLVPLAQICAAKMPFAPGKKIVLHCAAGKRSQMACEKLLEENPNLEIYNLEGGINAWTAAGLPVLQNGKAVLSLDRQVQLTIGVCVLTFSLLGYFVNPLFFWGSAFFGAGLTFAGLTGTCGLALVIAKMPWNRGSHQKNISCRPS